MSMPEDAAAFCAAEYPRLVGALGLYVGDRAVAEELAQEALLRACQRWERVSKLESPGGWTWHVARNLATSHFRRRRSERRATARVAAAHVTDSTATSGDDEDEVRRAVAALPDRQKSALVLRYYLDLSVEETARRMRITPDAVRSRSFASALPGHPRPRRRRAMPETTRQQLYDAAPMPHDVPDFDGLWQRGRRRRRVLQGMTTIAVVAVLGIAAGTVTRLVRPPDGQVRFVDEPPASVVPDDQTTRSEDTDGATVPGWSTVVVGDAAFDVPSTWPVYGDDGAAEYRARFCGLGQIGPALFITHRLPSNWGCRAVLLGHATGLEVTTTEIAAAQDSFSVWLDEPSTTGEMGGEPITRWQQDERQADEWTLLRYDRLGVYAHARIDLDEDLVFEILRTFRPATEEDRAADEARRAAVRTEMASGDWELVEGWLGPAGPPSLPGSAPGSIAGNENALNAIQGHSEAVVNQKMQQAPIRSDGSRGVGLAPEEAFTVTSTRFKRCIETYAGPDEASPAKPAPGPLQRYRRVSIRPRLDTIDSCTDWFAVDVYVDADGNVKGAVLDRYKP